jgi:hypothetical protein
MLNMTAENTDQAPKSERPKELEAHALPSP